MARKAATIARTAVTKQERVYGVLRERIRTGAYGPGHRIVIDQLAAELGVSALPVREAVRRVQAEGLVVFRRSSGACVAPADPEEVDAIAELLALVEGYVTALAAPHLSDAQIAHLRELASAMERAAASRDSGGVEHLEREFRAILAAHCPNLTLVRLLYDTVRQLGVARRALPPTPAGCEAQAVGGHRRLVELLGGGGSPTVIEHAARALRSAHTTRRLPGAPPPAAAPVR
jgi:DNA-binding GntR family transcriptional regulator